MNIFLVIFSLVVYSILNALVFYNFANWKIKLRICFKLICISIAFNKLFFTGSGYAVASYFSRRMKIPSCSIVSAFLLFEFFSILFWLILGIYFGAKLLINMPLILGIAGILFLITVVIKKDKFFSIIRNIFSHIKEVGKRFFLVIPLIFLNMIVFVMYYFFLFRCFNFHLETLSLIKIIAVSFTVGYLSFAPSGIGFKDAGLVLLLTGQGIPLDGAIIFALTDRLIVTFFWIGLGSIVGLDLIKEEFKKRFKPEKRV